MSLRTGNRMKSRKPRSAMPAPRTERARNTRINATFEGRGIETEAVEAAVSSVKLANCHHNNVSRAEKLRHNSCAFTKRCRQGYADMPPQDHAQFDQAVGGTVPVNGKLTKRINNWVLYRPG